MTGDDAYFSKASPFKIRILTEHLEKIGQKVTLWTNFDPPWSSYESINFLVLYHFWSFFLQKRENIVFTLEYPILWNFPTKSFIHYNTRFSWNFEKKSKVGTLGFFQKMAKNQVLSSSHWTPFLKYFFAKTGKCRFYTSISDFIEYSHKINFTLYYTIFLEFWKKIKGSYLRIFSKKAKKSTFELYSLNPILWSVFFTKTAN